MSGACGYLLKHSSVDQLLAGISAAATGECDRDRQGRSEEDVQGE